MPSKRTVSYPLITGPTVHDRPSTHPAFSTPLSRNAWPSCSRIRRRQLVNSARVENLGVADACSGYAVFRGRPPSRPFACDARALRRLRPAPRRAPMPTIRTFDCWPPDTRATRTSLVGALSGCASRYAANVCESPAQPSLASPPLRIPVAPAHRRSPHRSPRFRSRWGSNSSLNARFSKNSIAQLPSILLRVDSYPQFLASRRMTERAGDCPYRFALRHSRRP